MSIQDFKEAPLYSPELVSIFQGYSKESNVLWGITGDLDNLGVYVAHNGRAKAENLVDFYNKVIENSLFKWFADVASNDICLSFVPCGEEVIILGTCPKESVGIINTFFSDFESDIRLKVADQNYFDIQTTGASFGCKVFEDQSLDEKISALNEMVLSHQSESAIYIQYLKVMEIIRTILALELDRSKFKDILNGKYPIQIRQLVLSRMLLYKVSTKKIISLINQVDEKKKDNLLSSLGNQYGMTHEKSCLIDDIITQTLLTNG